MLVLTSEAYSHAAAQEVDHQLEIEALVTSSFKLSCQFSVVSDNTLLSNQAVESLKARHIATMQIVIAWDEVECISLVASAPSHSSQTRSKHVGLGLTSQVVLPGQADPTSGPHPRHVLRGAPVDDHCSLNLARAT
eukprot:1401085-Rhodomonas_salina.3